MTWKPENVGSKLATGLSLSPFPTNFVIILANTNKLRGLERQREREIERVSMFTSEMFTVYKRDTRLTTY